MEIVTLVAIFGIALGLLLGKKGLLGKGIIVPATIAGILLYNALAVQVNWWQFPSYIIVFVLAFISGAFASIILRFVPGVNKIVGRLG